MVSARVLFSTGSLFVFDLAYCFELAAEAGYDGVEVMCDERYSTRDPDYLQRLSQQYKLPVLVLHTPFSARVPGWRDANHDEIKRIRFTLELAEAIGAETIVVHVPRKLGQLTLSLERRTFHLPWRKPSNSVKHWIERDLPDEQARTKVKIALENMPAKYLAGRVDPTWWNEVETWSSVHRWLTLDTTHWGTKRVKPLDAYRAAGERVTHIHLSNYDGHEHALPFKGSLNLKSLLHALAMDGFAGTISLELSPWSLGFQEPALLRHNLRESLKFVRDNLR